MLLNSWRGWRAEYPEGWQPTPQEYTDILSEWNWVLDNVFGDDSKAREWVEHWLYYPIKFPGTKLHSFVMVCSRHQGIGKSFIGDMLAEYVYGLNAQGVQHASKIMEGRLAESFNSYLYAKSLVLGEDIAAHDKKSVYEKVKALVTSPTVEINIKNVPQFMVENCANFWLTSNDGAPFFLADMDRRAFVHVPRASKQDTVRFGKLAALFASGLGGRVLLWHARNKYEQGAFNPQADALRTTSKAEVILNGRSGIQDWICEIIEMANVGHLSRTHCTVEELMALMARDNEHLYRSANAISLGNHLNSMGCLRWGDGMQVLQRSKKKYVRAWVLCGNPAELTRETVEQGLDMPFDYKVVPLKRKAKY